MIDWIMEVIDRVFIRDERWRLWLSGAEASLMISFFSLMLGIVIGFMIALVRVTYDASDKPNIFILVLNRLFKIYISVIRGIPLVVQLLIWAFVILSGVRNGVLIASLAFGVNSGAYVAEVFRGGILSVDKGQMEAGRSLGLNFPQTMLKIILPQAIKNALPALLNEFITLFKSTSFAGMAAIVDITHAGNIIRGITFNQAPLFFVASFYLIIVVILEFFGGIIERRLRKSDKR